jgi:hypothetical protein
MSRRNTSAGALFAALWLLPLAVASTAFAHAARAQEVIKPTTTTSTARLPLPTGLSVQQLAD